MSDSVLLRPPERFSQPLVVAKVVSPARTARRIAEVLVALSQKHRSCLYLSLSPILGTEETEALLEEFPASDLDLPATNDFVRAELNREIGGLRSEMHQEIGGLRSEMHSLFRRHTMWFAGIVLTSTSVSTAINTWVVLSTR
jgi:hypothetical protein